MDEQDALTFATGRQTLIDSLEDSLRRSVRIALSRYPAEGWYDALLRRVEVIFAEEYLVEWESDFSDRRVLEAILENAAASLDHIETVKDDHRDQTETITEALAVAIANGITETRGLESEDPMMKMWVTMEDTSVRPAHREVHLSTVPVGEPFTVAGVEMSRPGDMSAPPELFINCRCVLALAPASQTAAGILAGTTGGTMEDDIEVPFYGVLAPEGVPTADGRRFAVGSMRWRDLPLPLLWQKFTDEGHDKSVIVGSITEIWREEESNLLRFRGRMLHTPEAEEFTYLIAEGALRGVSVDVYDVTMQIQDLAGNEIDLEEAMAGLIDEDVEYLQTLVDGEIAGATGVAFPAFREAFISLGTDDIEGELDELVASIQAGADFAISEKAWDGSASRFTPQEWYRSTIIHLSDDKENKSDHKLPIREPNGDLSRAGVHAAAGRLNQTDAPAEQINRAKAALRSAYQELDEEPPEAIAAAAEDGEEFIDVAPGRTEDGPGWLTHPVDTDRLRDYWVRGAGAAKIGWGAPGDFNRCRLHLAKYIKPQYLSGYCANRHYDALGFWPGQHHSLSAAAVPGEGESYAEPWNVVESVVASADTVAPVTPPIEWFGDPHLDGPTPVTVTEDGRIFGHLAAWGTCHVGIGNSCVTPPRSFTNYSRYMTGVRHTTGGDVPVGNITLGTGHADTKLREAAAVAHYDNTGTVAADVVVGEDAHGIWVAGALRPYLSEEAVIELKGSALSGDWRIYQGSLELVAALAVNVPGFPVPHTSLAASGTEQISLVASGIVERSDFTVEEIEDIVRRVVAADREAEQAAADLAEVAAARAKRELDAVAAMRGRR